MATVPVYDAPQQELRAAPGVKQSSLASPDILGGQADQQLAAAGGLLKTGSALTAAATRMQELENADMIFRAETALHAEYQKHEAALNERKGQNAWGATADNEKWWGEAAKKHSEGLGNDVQRQLFGRRFEKLRQQSMGKVSAFEAGERRKSVEESANASIVGEINMAAANANAWAPAAPPSEDGTPAPLNPVSAAKQEIVKRVKVMGALNGWSPERATFEEAKHLTNLHTQVIQNLADKNPAKAREYYAANKAEINGTSYDALDKTLKMGGIKETAQSFADAVIADNMDESSALALARANLKGEEQSAAITEVKLRFAERTQARERKQRDAADTAWGLFTRSGGNINAIPAATLAELDGRDLAALQKAADTAGTDKLPKTDWDKYAELRRIAIDNPQAFAKEDLRRHFPYLGKAEREGLLDLQGKIKSPEEAKDAATLSQQLSVVHNSLGWRAGDNEKKGKFDRVVQDAIDTEQRRTGKKLNYADRQRIIDRMVMEGEVMSGSMFLPDRNVRRYEVEGTADAKRFEVSVPDDHATEIRRVLRAKGMPATPSDVLREYKKANGL